MQVEVELQDQLREAAEYRVALQDALKEAEAEARRVELERELEERARREEEERLARKQVLAIFMHNEYARLLFDIPACTNNMLKYRITV